METLTNEQEAEAVRAILIETYGIEEYLRVVNRQVYERYLEEDKNKKSP